MLPGGFRTQHHELGGQGLPTVLATDSLAGAGAPLHRAVSDQGGRAWAILCPSYPSTALKGKCVKHGSHVPHCGEQVLIYPGTETPFRAGIQTDRALPF